MSSAQLKEAFMQFIRKDKVKSDELLREYVSHQFSSKSGLSLEGDEDMDMPAPKSKEMMSSDDDIMPAEDMPEDGVKHSDKFVDDFDDIHDGEISDSDVKVIEHLFKFSLEQYPDIFKYEFADGECEDEMKVVDVSAFEDSIMTHLKCGKHYVVIDTPKAAFADIEEDDMDESFALWVKANSVVSYHNDETTVDDAE